MKKAYLNVQKEFCGECSLALMHYIGNMKGVDSITAEDGKVALTFDDAEISEESLLKLTRETIERLGYKIVEGHTAD
jgi:copper chaperone CopZ